MDQIACGACGKTYQINPSYYGKSFQCQCGQMVNVPAPGGAPPPPPQAGHPPPPPPGYAPQPGYGAPAQAQGTPGIVIAGFILAFLCPLIGLILCAVGMGEAKRRGAGTGLATAGIVIGIVMMVLGIIINVAAAS